MYREDDLGVLPLDPLASTEIYLKIEVWQTLEWELSVPVAIEKCHTSERYPFHFLFPAVLLWSVGHGKPKEHRTTDTQHRNSGSQSISTNRPHPLDWAKLQKSTRLGVKNLTPLMFLHLHECTTSKWSPDGWKDDCAVSMPALQAHRDLDILTLAP